MKHRYGRVLAALVMMLVVAVSEGASANGSVVSAAGSKPQPSQQGAKPQVAEPNPSWHDQYPDYYKVRMASATDGWIVGAEGAIRRYAGGQWVAYNSPVTSALRSVYPISNTAWAVGDNNVIMQFSNDAWQVTPGPNGCANFRDVWMVAPNNGWAVGSTCEVTPTAVLAHYNGSTWQSAAVPTNTTGLNAVQMISSSEGWAVGNAGIILHYTGGSWQPVNSGITTDIYSIAMLPDGSEGWAGISGSYCYPYSNSLIPTLRYTNGAWGESYRERPKDQPSKPSPCVAVSAEAYGVAALNETSRWYVGSRHSESNYDGGGSDSGLMSQGTTEPNGWEDPEVANTSRAAALYSVYMVAANDVWAVGTSGYIEHYNGSGWSNAGGAKVAIDGLAYNPVRHELYQAGSGGPPAEAIVVTNLDNDNTMLQCSSNRATWKAVSSVPGGNLEAWAVGLSQSGNPNFRTTLAMVSHITSAGCSASAVITNDFTSPIGLNSVVAVSSTLVVAVGDRGTLAVYQGAWLTETLGSHNLNGISYRDGRYWTVGSGGTIYTTNGDPSNIASWTAISADPNDNLAAVFALSNSEAWAVGDHVYYHIVGNNAARIAGDSNLSAVYMNSGTDGWAVGVDGSVVHFGGSSWTMVTNTGMTLRAITFTPNGDGFAGANDFGDTQPALYHLYNFIAGHLLHYAPACYDYYTDVPPGYYAHQYILDLSCRGIISGIGGHIYAPNANATRIQFAKIITLARGWQLISPPNPTFSDVPPSNPLYSFVETAHANNAISGADVATCQARGLAYPCFLPNDPISRAQAVVITVRAFAWPIDTTGGPHFTDVLPSNFAYQAVETAYNRNVVSGVGGGLFTPNANVTRAQIAKIVDLAIASP